MPQGNNQYYMDFWKFDLETLEWTKIREGSIRIGPKRGAHGIQTKLAVTVLQVTSQTLKELPHATFVQEELGILHLEQPLFVIARIVISPTLG
jgi:hypothetical protein